MNYLARVQHEFRIARGLGPLPQRRGAGPAPARRVNGYHDIRASIVLRIGTKLGPAVTQSSGINTIASSECFLLLQFDLMTNRPLGVVVALALGALLGDCGTKVLTPDSGTGPAGRGGAAAGSGGAAGAGGIGGGSTDGGRGGAGGWPYGFAGFNGAAGNGTGGTGTSVCATNFACGVSGQACALGQEFCYGPRGGAGSSGAVPQVCRSLPAGCAGNPSCDCVCPSVLDNCPGLGFGCICNISDGALRLDCPGAGAAGGGGGAGGAGGCPYGLAGFNGSAGGNGGGGGSGVLCATPPRCGSSTCAPDQEYCHAVTVMGGAGQNGGGRGGNSGNGGSSGTGGGGGMTDPYNTCTSFPAACASNPSCACACPNCPTGAFPSPTCSCSVVNGEVIVHCIEYAI